MANTIGILSRFIDETEYSDLASEAAREVKRIVLDSIGCALAGKDSDKGRWGIAFGRAFFAGPEQAAVLGYPDRLSAVGASFVNAELINALDYDPAGKHLPPFVIAPAMAAAEMGGRSGAELLAAVAAALEIGTRMGKCMGSYRDVKADGKVAGLPPVTGHSCAVFGGAGAVAKLSGMDESGIAQSMGMAGLLSPANTQTPMHRDLPTNSGKYLMAGWAAQTCLTAPSLIRFGHRGDLNILDGEYGYWRFIGASSWNPEPLTRELGERWLFVRGTPIKQFPCCRMMHGGLECLREIVEKNALRPEEIEHIHAYLEPTSVEPVFGGRTIVNQIDAQFSVAYNMAVAAFGIAPGVDWQSEETMRSADILAFMDRVDFEPHPDSAAALKADPNARLSAVEVTARGQVYQAEKRYIRGTVTDDPATSFTDEELRAKFLKNAAVALPEEQAEAAYETLSRLEEIGDIRDVTALLTGK